MINTTHVPNILFDQYLRHLTESELKILLVIIRQTHGWVDKRTGKRKTKDRISQSQFQLKTGLSIRIISETLRKLSTEGLIRVVDQNGKPMNHSLERKGKRQLFYSFQPMHFTTSTYANNSSQPMQKSAYNKRNYTKENETKERQEPLRFKTLKSISEIIEKGYLT